MPSTLFLAAALIATPQQAQPAPAQNVPAQAAPAQTAPTQTAPAQGAPGQGTPGQGTPAQNGAAQATTATPAGATTIGAALPTLPDHATLAKLVTAAKLVPTLSGPGPFTLFAPNDAAFALLPAGTIDQLLAPANIASLTTILKNHVVAGALSADQIKAQITAGGGRTTLTTLSGQTLTASIENGNILLTDAVGNKSYVDKADMREANGVIHGTNGLSFPKLG